MKQIKKILFAGIVILTAATASMGNTAPVADAGEDQVVGTASKVKLDGRGSYDVDKDRLKYSWSIISKPEGSAPTISKKPAKKPKFTADADGSYVIQLIVYDGTIDSDPDTVTVRVGAENTAPVADAGADQNIHSGSTVTLNGSESSDPDGDNFTYNWSFEYKPEGSNASFSNATLINPKFIADVDGDYIIQLIVNDARIESAPDTVTITATNNSGTLDPAFGESGIVASDVDGSIGEVMTLDSERNIYVVGYDSNGYNDNMLIWKYRSDGTPDTAFGDNGIVVYVGESDSLRYFDRVINRVYRRRHSITLDSAGNIYVAGFGRYSDNDNMLIWKYRSDGTPDTAFGDNGITGYVVNGSGNSITLDSAGNIYVAGFGRYGDNNNMLIWKYRSDGTPDTAFGDNGITGYVNASGNSITLDSAGNIYVAGTVVEYEYNLYGNYTNIATWKYKRDGTPDTAFGDNGMVSWGVRGTMDKEIILSADYGYGIVLDNNENIYVTGNTYSDSGHFGSMVILKYRSEGILDTSFGGNGVVSDWDVYNVGKDIILDSIGNIYVAGTNYQYYRDQDYMHIWKYKSNGMPDTTFGDNGVVIYDDAIGETITLDSAGNIYVAGTGWFHEPTNMLIWKYK